MLEISSEHGLEGREPVAFVKLPLALAEGVRGREAEVAVASICDDPFSVAVDAAAVVLAR